MSMVLNLQALPVETASPDLAPYSMVSVIDESCGDNSYESLYCG